MSQYSRGAAIERKVVQFLKSKGYEATRSAGSKGTFDVIAYNNNLVRFIQVKLGVNPKRSQYTKDFYQIKYGKTPMWNTSKELWVYTHGKGFTNVYAFYRKSIDDLDASSKLEYPEGAIWESMEISNVEEV